MAVARSSGSRGSSSRSSLRAPSARSSPTWARTRRSASRSSTTRSTSRSGSPSSRRPARSTSQTLAAGRAACSKRRPSRTTTSSSKKRWSPRRSASRACSAAWRSTSARCGATRRSAASSSARRSRRLAARSRRSQRRSSSTSSRTRRFRSGCSRSASSTSVAGPALGGVLIAVLGLTGAYLLDAATFAASLWSVWRLPSLAPLHDAERPSWQTIVEGFRFARRKKVLLGMFLVDSNAMVFGMPRALFPAIALRRFNGGAATLGLMYAAPYAGALVASVLSGWIPRVRRQGLIVAVAAALWGAAIAAFGFAESLWLALIFLAAAGAADNVSAVLRGTILWTVTPDSFRGRLSGIEHAQVAATPAIGNVEAAVVASLTSLRVSIVSGGLLCIAGTFLIAFAVPAFFRYDARAPT